MAKAGIWAVYSSLSSFPANCGGLWDYQEFRAWGSNLRPEVIPHVREVREEEFTRDTC
jgi:hypothetical protein